MSDTFMDLSRPTRDVIELMRHVLEAVASRLFEVEQQPAGVVACGELRIDLGRDTVTRAGERLPLGAKEYALLAALASTPGSSVAFEELIDAIWTDDPPASRARALCTLADKLRAKVGHRDAIETLRGAYSLQSDEPRTSRSWAGPAAEYAFGRAATAIPNAAAFHTGDPRAAIAQLTHGARHLLGLIQRLEREPQKRASGGQRLAVAVAAAEQAIHLVHRDPRAAIRQLVRVVRDGLHALAPGVIDDGDLRINLRTRTATRGHEPLDLRPREYVLLASVAARLVGLPPARSRPQKSSVPRMDSIRALRWC